MIRPILDVAKEMREIFGHYELTKKELKRTEDLIDKIENHKITVSVIGQFKRGQKKYLEIGDLLCGYIIPYDQVSFIAITDVRKEY